MDSFEKFASAYQLLTALAVSSYGLCSTLALIFGFLGNKYPMLMNLAYFFGRIGASLHHVGEWMGKMSFSKKNERGYVSRMEMAIIAGAIGMVCVAVSPACGLFSRTILPGAKLAECIYEHAESGEKVEQIAVSCSADLLEVVQTLLEAKKNSVAVSPAAMQARHMKSELAK